MIIVVAHAVVKAGMADAFITAAQDCIKQTRMEGGNISYTLLKDSEFPDKLTFLEQWESKAPLDAHMKTPHFEALGPAVSALLAKPLTIDVYTAEQV